VRYCGVVAAGSLLQLAMLEELRADEPPIRLDAVFFEPAGAVQVARELRGLPEKVVAVGGPRVGGERRVCDRLLRERGVAPQPLQPEIGNLFHALHDLGVFGASDAAPDASDGPVPEGTFREAPVFETNPDGVFCALQGRRVPARRHPLGVRVRIQELADDHVMDGGGELWHRRIEEIDAAAAALCAHRYAVGHASWLGAPEEGVVVLPGTTIPGRFPTQGVLPPVERLELPRAPWGP
jgi:hypothetical protein